MNFSAELSIGHKSNFNIALREQLKVKVMEIAVKYNITPIMAGLYGSRAKGCAGPQSDFDFYVPYVGQVKDYVKALDVNTKQVHAEETLPAQLTFMMLVENIEYKVQLNFEDYPHFVSELSKNNIDFQLAVYNEFGIYAHPESISLFKELIACKLSLLNIKHHSIDRVRKVLHQLQENNKRVKPSEVMDGLYRLFMAASAISPVNNCALLDKHDRTLLGLFKSYRAVLYTSPDTTEVVKGILLDVISGKWKDSCGTWSNALITLFSSSMSTMQSLPTPNQKKKNYSPTETLVLYDKINTEFIKILLQQPIN